MTFVVELVRHGAVARHNTAQGKIAARRLAFHLGQLVEDPWFICRQEQEEQEEGRQRYQRALADNHHFGWKINDHDRWSAESAQAAIEGALRDAQLVNDLIHDFLKAFGLLERVKQMMLVIHASWDDGSAPLFTKEAWLRWWGWAESGFFANELSAR